MTVVPKKKQINAGYFFCLIHLPAHHGHSRPCQSPPCLPPFPTVFRRVIPDFHFKHPRERLLSHIPGQVAYLLAERVEMACRGDVRLQVPLLMLQGVQQLHGARRPSNADERQPAPVVGVRHPSVQVAAMQLLTGSAKEISCTASLSQVVQEFLGIIAVGAIVHDYRPSVPGYLEAVANHATGTFSRVPMHLWLPARQATCA